MDYILCGCFNQLDHTTLIIQCPSLVDLYLFSLSLIDDTVINHAIFIKIFFQNFQRMTKFDQGSSRNCQFLFDLDGSAISFVASRNFMMEQSLLVNGMYVLLTEFRNILVLCFFARKDQSGTCPFSFALLCRFIVDFFINFQLKRKLYLRIFIVRVVMMTMPPYSLTASYLSFSNKCNN